MLNKQALVTLTMDNGSVNNDIKLKVKCTIEQIERAAKKVFGWRTATKNYNTIYERVQGLSSLRYDTLILFLHNAGYGVE